MPSQPGYYRHPTVHGSTVVFVCEDDLWSVSLEGGVAQRLTASAGQVSFARLSPNGKMLAYTSTEEGAPEAYVMPAAGGPARRLTWMSSLLRTVGWSKDGKSVIVATGWRQPFMRSLCLYEVPLAGGPVRPIPVGHAREIAYQQRGDGVAIGRNTQDPARWKRYRGGTAGRLWVRRQDEEEFEPLVELEGNLAAPMWIGGRIYFLSDHEGHGNIYSCTPKGGGLKRLTDHEAAFARFPSTDGKHIVYHCGADLWAYDVKGDAGWKIDVELHSPRHGLHRRFVKAPGYLESASIHPEGHSLACSVRGGAYTFPLWEGATRRHGRVSAARYRHTRWLQDGRHVVCVTDEAGEETLAVFATAKVAKGPSGFKARITLDIGRVLDLWPAPAGGDRVALANHRQELWVVDLKTGKGKVVDRSEFSRIAGAAWSPDGRWLAYGFSEDMRTTCLRLHDTRTGRIHTLTRSEFHDHEPAFDPQGRYLYFLSAREFDPVYDGQYFDLGFPKGEKPFLIPLSADTPSPFAAGNRQPRAPGATAGDDSPAKKAAEKKAKAGGSWVEVDLEGIEDRVVAFPVPEGRYQRVGGGKDRVFFTSAPIEGSLGDAGAGDGQQGKSLLEYYDLQSQKVETFMGRVSDFELTAKGTEILVRAGKRLRAVSATLDPSDLSSKTNAGRDTGWVDLGRLSVELSPGDEWRQIFREAWRLQRDQFWSEDMSSVDWQAVHDRYLPLVDRCATRAEFSDLMWETQGELGTSHCYEMGGDYHWPPQWEQGSLGADLELDAGSGRWKVKRIPRGDSWNEGASSPLAAPGLSISEGDAILAIDGRPVDAATPPDALLVNRRRSEVTLTVTSGARRTRDVVVKVLANELELRYRDWVEANREWTHRRSRGKVGYIHIPNMGPKGYSEFHRYFRQELDYPGLIIDVRWNGGGHVSQLLLQKLARKRLGYDATRWHGNFPYPMEAGMGPMVALTNEHAGSDGDIFSHCFKLMGLGPLIGMRTWGGVVGIWPRHSLVDGTVTSQPEFSFWFEDVGWGVENYGTDPDIEVDVTPEDHVAGRDPQLERGLAEVQAIIKRDKPRVPPLTRRPSLKPPRLPKR